MKSCIRPDPKSDSEDLIYCTALKRARNSLLTSSGSRSELLLLYALLVEDTELQRRIVVVVVSFLLGPPSLVCFSSYLDC